MKELFCQGKSGIILSVGQYPYLTNVNNIYADRLSRAISSFSNTFAFLFWFGRKDRVSISRQMRRESRFDLLLAEGSPKIGTLFGLDHIPLPLLPPLGLGADRREASLDCGTKGGFVSWGTRGESKASRGRF
jgi:hypothetical protein